MGMLLVYKLLHGCVKCNLLDNVNVSTGVGLHNTSGNIFKINKSHAKLSNKIFVHQLVLCLKNLCTF